MNTKFNSFIHGVLPTILLSLSVGQVYAFSYFNIYISNTIKQPLQIVQFAFSLAIFFLGMGAAFFGKIVEKNIKLSTIIGTNLFILGLIITSLSLYIKSVTLLYLGYGVLLGIGTGIIYICPVKTMMLWFPTHKFLASALPIIFFGLGSSFSVLLYNKVFEHILTSNANDIFIIYAGTYLLMMLPAICLLKKPTLKITSKNNNFSYTELLKNKFFIHSWLFMFLNISAGLCLIPLSVQMMQNNSYTNNTIFIIMSLAGIFNGCGRFIFAFISDKIKTKLNIITYISLISLFSMVFCYIYQPIIGLVLLIINACYGAGFSVIPGILSTHYGMLNISKIHGAVLSAWGVAGLVGNQLAILISNKFNFGNTGVIILLIVMYTFNLINCLIIRKCNND